MSSKFLLTDVHNHTKFSADGRSPIEDMLKTAYEKGIAYYGISEHFDYDYVVDGIPFYGEGDADLTDAEAYFARARELQKEYEGKMHVLVGGEYGFTANPKAVPMYRALTEKYRPDFIVNSVHTEGTNDYYRRTPYYNADGSVRDKKEVYGHYFDLAKKSAEAEYDYDILAHLTYCIRYAPYEEKLATVKEFSAEIDGVLKAVIARKKILEVNSSNRGGAGAFVPSGEIVARYYALGGRKISYASDAHEVKRVADKRDTVIAALKEIGFTYLTVPCRGEHIEVEI